MSSGLVCWTQAFGIFNELNMELQQEDAKCLAHKASLASATQLHTVEAIELTRYLQNQMASHLPMTDRSPIRCQLL
jgi:hypothetical protein